MQGGSTRIGRWRWVATKVLVRLDSLGKRVPPHFSFGLYVLGKCVEVPSNLVQPLDVEMALAGNNKVIRFGLHFVFESCWEGKEVQSNLVQPIDLEGWRWLATTKVLLIRFGLHFKGAYSRTRL